MGPSGADGQGPRKPRCTSFLAPLECELYEVFMDIRAGVARLDLSGAHQKRRAY